MEERLSGDPHKYIRKMLENSSKVKVLSKEGNKTELFWNTQCSPETFKPHPDVRQSILYKPVNK